MASKETEKLKSNVEEQLERLVKQLEDLEQYRWTHSEKSVAMFC